MFFRGLNLFILLLICFSTGCAASSSRKTVKINGVVLYNNTSKDMYDVVVLVPETNKKIFCSYISAYNEFQTEYPAKKFQGKDVEFFWTHRQKRWNTGLIKVDIPKNIDRDTLFKPIAVLGEQGRVSVRFETNYK